MARQKKIKKSDQKIVNNKQNTEHKKAVSPVVATVLLVMLVIILAIIILLWVRSFTSEAITKDIGNGPTIVANICKEVSLREVSAGGGIGFENIGNVPLYGYVLKTTDTSGNSNSQKIYNAVVPGATEIADDDLDLGDYDSVSIIPILLGKSSASTTQEWPCDKYPLEIK